MCIFCGFPAKGAMTAHILYILERFFEESAAFSVPIGGTSQLGETLQRGLEKFGGKLQLNAHVDEILVENNRAVGVRLKNGNVIKARKAVVSNATPFDTVKMIHQKEDENKKLTKWRSDLGTLPRHGAISHLFLGVDATGLDLSHLKDPAHLIVQDWDRSMQDSQNLCSFFIPSLLDKTVCPEGKHVIHVYSSGGEPYEPWEKLTPGTEEYEAYKKERVEVLFRAVERAIPDIRDRLEFTIIGSPLAHEAFLRRDRGTYGMAWAAGSSAPQAGLLGKVLPFPFPNLKTPVDGLLRCGDSCFPGIGTPSAEFDFDNGVFTGTTPQPIESDWDATVRVLGGDNIHVYELSADEGIANGYGDFNFNWVSLHTGGGYLDKDDFYGNDGCYTFEITIENEYGSTLVSTDSQIRFYWDDNRADDDTSNDKPAEAC